MGKLDGKVVIVTGAGRGIGFSHASLLAAEGASVVVNDIGGTAADDAVAQICAADGTALANRDDIATWEGGANLVTSAVAEFGRLDGLVLNAGIIRDKMLINMSETEWDAVMAVHLKGHFAPLQAAANHWRDLSKSTGEPARGHLVMTSSEAGLFGNVGQANYSAAKNGIVSLAMVAARELERYGVTVNVICPRSRTPMTEHLGLFDATEGFDLWDPDNIAPWVAHLCTDSAEHITGQTFVVHGGTVTLMEPWREAASIVANHRWSLDELEVRQGELFAGRSSTTIPFPDPTASRA